MYKFISVFKHLDELYIGDHDHRRQSIHCGRCLEAPWNDEVGEFADEPMCQGQQQLGVHLEARYACLRNLIFILTMTSDRI